MRALWALMHLVAAGLTAEVPIHFQDPTDGLFAARESEYDEAKLVARYATLLGMPADEAWALALCRGNREEAFGG